MQLLATLAETEKNEGIIRKHNPSSSTSFKYVRTCVGKQVLHYLHYLHYSHKSHAPHVHRHRLTPTPVQGHADIRVG